MALSRDMRSVLELLMNALLARKESFSVIFAKMKPIVHYEAEFYVAFFVGYVAHSYKQMFLSLTNRDMHYDEINEALEFLMRNESRIREALLGREVPREEIEHVPEKVELVPEKEVERVPEKEEKIKPVEIGIEKRANDLELSVEEIRREINLIKQSAKEKITKYEIQLARNGKFKESIL